MGTNKKWTDRYDFANPLFKELATPAQQRAVDLVLKYGSPEKAGKAENVNERNIRGRLEELSKKVAAGFEQQEIIKGDIKKSDRYVITCAQNMTAPHSGFLSALESYCAQNNAELIIIPIRYRNPTTEKEDPKDEWDKRIRKYISGERKEIIPGVMLMGDIKTQPTAVNPLSGLHTITGNKCGIFGHTKVAMETIPTPGQELPKILMTTGSITASNYSDSKAGKKGEFHHVLGAVIVEAGDSFHFRFINAQSDGSFIDLNTRYIPNKATKKAPRPSALVLGDLHAARHDPDNLAAVMDIIDTLKPRRIVCHDVLDFQSAGHHNDFFTRFRLHQSGKDKVIEEIRYTCDVLDKLAAKADLFIVCSNHDEHLYRWLENHHNGMDIVNARIYHELKAEMLGVIQDKDYIPDPFELAAKKIMKKKARFVGRKESLQVHGIEMSEHGDKGPNGARGNANAFDKIGVKTIIGHSHTPRIVGGCYQAGTSSLLDMEYNTGPSSWLHSHVVVYGNGKRSHINVINGQWKL